MSFVLMVLGLLTTALGAVLIGTGIPINEFNLGNTLILSGTVTVVSGLVIFALSRVVGQLSRIADLLTARPFAPALPAGSEPFDLHHPDAGRAAPPRAPGAMRPRAEAPAPQRGPEPRLQSDDFALPEAVEPVRPPPPARVPPSTGEPHEDAVRTAPRPGADATARTGWRPPRPAEPRRAKPPEPRAPAAPKSAPEPALGSWDESKGAAAAVDESRRQPAASRESEREARAEPVTVLKSGVVDGMAYTLYTDGSIEAELAQGVVRFGSIEELRNHLEKST